VVNVFHSIFSNCQSVDSGSVKQILESLHGSLAARGNRERGRTRIGAVNRGIVPGSAGVSPACSVFGSRLAGGTPALPGFIGSSEETGVPQQTKQALRKESASARFYRSHGSRGMTSATTRRCRNFKVSFEADASIG
jgi:hypothetical protein